MASSAGTNRLARAPNGVLVPRCDHPLERENREAYLLAADKMPGRTRTPPKRKPRAGRCRATRGAGRRARRTEYDYRL